MSEILGFDPSEVPADEYEGLPDGQYVACVDKIEKKESKSGDYDTFSIMYGVLDGEHANKKAFQTVCVAGITPNANQDAIRIGRQYLLKLIESVGKKPSELKDMSEINSLPVLLTVINKGGRANYKVAKYAAANAAPAAPAIAPAAVAPAVPRVNRAASFIKKP